MTRRSKRQIFASRYRHDRLESAHATRAEINYYARDVMGFVAYDPYDAPGSCP